jgi:hypothetical protein
MTSKISILKNSMFAVIVATLPLAAANASAQTRHVDVDVPFAFVANHTSFPAGHYTIIGDGPFLRLSNTDTGKSEGVLLSRSEAGYSVEDESKLQFYVSGSRHVLTEIRFAQTGTRTELAVQPKPERVVARNAEPSGRILEIGTR